MWTTDENEIHTGPIKEDMLKQRANAIVAQKVKDGRLAAYSDSDSDSDEEDKLLRRAAYHRPTTSRGYSQKSQLPKKTAAMAIFLLIVGIGFGIAGAVIATTKSVRDAIPFLVIGGIGFIPGSFATLILLAAYCGFEGYTYDMLPSYDE